MMIWKIVKGIIFGTGLYVWGKAVYDNYTYEPEPIVRPIMYR